MVKLDIMSDPICPWCYIGKTHLDRALAQRPDHPFLITWHPFQLNPEMPKEGVDRRAYLEGKFGGKEGAIKAYAPLVEHAEKAGLSINFEGIQKTPNTLDAHRLIHWAGIEGHQNAVVDALFTAYFVDGRDIELDRLSAEVATGSTGVDGLFRFVDSDYLPEPGRTISVALTLPELSDVIALPPVALYGTDRIYRVTDARLEAVSVNHLGYRTNSDKKREILIKSDQLNAGDKIITTQLPNAVSGMLVEVKQ